VLAAKAGSDRRQRFETAFAYGLFNSMKRWTESFALSLSVQQVIATVGAMLLGIAVVDILGLIVAAFTKNIHPAGNIVDRMVDLWFVRVGGDGPYFVGPILAAFFLGSWSRKRFGFKAGAYVWIIPTSYMLLNMLRWHSWGSIPWWRALWDDFFSSDCGNSGCFYEFFVTGPFYTSLAYTIGWLVKRQTKHRPEVFPVDPSTPNPL